MAKFRLVIYPTPPTNRVFVALNLFILRRGYEVIDAEGTFSSSTSVCSFVIEATEPDIIRLRNMLETQPHVTRVGYTPDLPAFHRKTQGEHYDRNTEPA